MYNETSCRLCGWELTALLKCRLCEETNSWICKKCGNTIHHLHSHDLRQLTPITNVNTISLV